MTLRSAAGLAIVGMALLTIRLTVNLITNISGVLGGFIPANALLVSLINFLAGLSLLVFFAVFYKSKP